MVLGIAGVLSRVLERRPLSLPIAFLALRLGCLRPAAGLPDQNPLRHPQLTEHLTEICVIVALMGAGLKIDRPFGWHRWASTWRLLAVAVPLTITAVALLGRVTERYGFGQLPGGSGSRVGNMKLAGAPVSLYRVFQCYPRSW
ncbi:hypothetical protein [Krasilnikovia sp. M28-CT-15]|uniref:hypothetical protein n=1 Tax=Krasilnikovia sp. M28-CT-15 TaxID=3373540 RepID=UPI0038764648